MGSCSSRSYDPSVRYRSYLGEDSTSAGGDPTRENKDDSRDGPPQQEKMSELVELLQEEPKIYHSQERNDNPVEEIVSSDPLEHAEECYEWYREVFGSTPYKDLDERQKADKQIALGAIFRSGHNLRHAPATLQNDKEVVLVACAHAGYALNYASHLLQNDKDVVFAACSQHGLALICASQRLKGDKEVVLMACGEDGLALQHASQKLQNNKEVVLVACAQNGTAVQYASDRLRNNKEVALKACSQTWHALKFVSPPLQNNKEVIAMACSQHGWLLRNLSPELQNDKEVVLAACSENGEALKFASDSLRADKEVVMAAAESKPESLKFALGGLNQDKDCLIKARLWDEGYEDRKTINLIESNNNSLMAAHTNKKKIVLSTKFSLAAKSSPHATKFTIELKKHPYIANGDFLIYSPNAFNKGTCDPNWTDRNWPCRGTYSSCEKPHHLKLGVPQEEECCWRYSFRYHLREAATLGGFMIQVVDAKNAYRLSSSSSSSTTNPNRDDYHDLYENHTLGDGQSIEIEMAQDERVKIFRFFEPGLSRQSSYAEKVDKLVYHIQNWYNDGCSNMEECNVHTAQVAQYSRPVVDARMRNRTV